MNEVKVFSEATQYIKIAVGEEFYGVDISIIENIVRMQRITRVPNVAEYIKGVINLRGEIVPIMNLRLKIGLDEIEYTKDTRIIIIKTENFGKIGLIVDAVKVSSAIPFATLPIMFAVAGATKTMSAFWASEICFMS